MKLKRNYAIIATCVLLLSIASVTALEEFSSLEGKVVKIESQEELFNVVSGLDWSNSNPVYLIMPKICESSKKSNCHSCEKHGDDTACQCDVEYAPSEPCCHTRTAKCPSTCHDGCHVCVRNSNTGKLVANRCGL